ncbi:MAG: MBL fold metallo-hydrolase [Burkholderiaceae bacterium]|nr:MBL fold metallo-hydrolase [Burkholderiaceae bacterium]MDH3460464.1 MBL fold metallo-hydrolase [Burkholderiaceae bacterium]
MQFCSLGSGSSGNALVVEARSGATTTRLLIDCGFSCKELNLRLAKAGLAADDLDAIFVTHEHGDHVGCALALSRQSHLPLWMSYGTWCALGRPELAEPLLHFARDGENIHVGDLELSPYTVPHDAQEPLQLRCSDGAHRLGVLTDLGSSTMHLLAELQRCDALVLECNHERELLWQSRYPDSLKARIGGLYGHLANDTAAQILGHCHHTGLRHVVAAHLSEQNNTPALAASALAAACGAAPGDIVVADPLLGVGWLSLS